MSSLPTIKVEKTELTHLRIGTAKFFVLGDMSRSDLIDILTNVAAIVRGTKAVYKEGNAGGAK